MSEHSIYLYEPFISIKLLSVGNYNEKLKRNSTHKIYRAMNARTRGSIWFHLFTLSRLRKKKGIKEND